MAAAIVCLVLILGVLFYALADAVLNDRTERPPAGRRQRSGAEGGVTGVGEPEGVREDGRGLGSVP